MCNIILYLQVIFHANISYPFLHFFHLCFIVQEILKYVINILKVPSVVMMCSWIGGLVILIFRIIMINDFRILRIKIYELKEE